MLHHHETEALLPLPDAPCATTILNVEMKARYEQKVFLPLIAASQGKTDKKQLYPIFRGMDWLFTDFCYLLQHTEKAYRTSIRSTSPCPPIIWLLLFWSLAFRLVGGGQFFTEAFHGRLPFPDAADLDSLKLAMLARKAANRTVFGYRYINQGIHRTVAVLMAFIQARLCEWAFEGTKKATPQMLFKYLTRLERVSTFYSWQVRCG